MAQATEFEIDDGKKVLNELVVAHRSLVLSDANEANTRAKVIDAMLRGVLHWHDDDISWEERVSEDRQTTFADYYISTATTHLIVEAKRAGAAFVLPSRMTSARMGGVLSEGAVGEAIRQARDYCRKRAAQFAVATNGSAWIVFPATRTDGVPFEESQARVFRDLDDVQQRFVEFWELLSRQRVVEGNLERELLGVGREPSGRRPLMLLREPDYKLNRNTLYEHVAPAVTHAFTDEGMTTDVSALRACYVLSSERVKYDSRLKMALSDPKPSIGRTAVRVRSRKNQKYLDQKIAATTQTPQFFLILGPVGAGKTTFLNYTRNVSAEAEITKRILWLVVDFRKATQADDPRRFLYSQLLTLIESDVEFGLGDWNSSILAAYRQRIDALARGPLFPIKQQDEQLFQKHVSEMVMADRTAVEPYVDAIIANALTKRPGFLVVDNVDQIESDTAQNAIFGEVQAAARRMGINVVMSLRDSTYIRNRNSPVFDAFQLDTMYVDPPSVIPVLSRRFQFARGLLANKKVELTLSNGFHLRVDDLGVFFDIVAQSLLSEEPAFMFDVLSGGDIRRGLSLAREFISSGHTTADWALHNYLSDRSYRFAMHEIFKGATLGSRRFYREEDSLIPNIFSAKLGTPSLQLLRLRIIHFVVSQSSTLSSEGYVADDIINELHQVGVPQSDIDKTIRRLLDFKVLRTADGGGYQTSTRVLATRLAGYLLAELCKRFDYTEMCMFDATVYDDQSWERIVQLTASIQRERDPLAMIPNRIERVREFVRYLTDLEESWVVQCKRRNLHPWWSEQIISSAISPALEMDFERVAASAERQRLRRQGYRT